VPSKSVVLDANILIRAVLGKRVRAIIEARSEEISFFVPEEGLSEAERHLNGLVTKRGGDPVKASAVLRSVAALVTIVGHEVYSGFETEARRRLGRRDPEDWPIVATALALDSPIWTEDADFFGCGIAIWTSTSIDIFFGQ
jgi:predicted nucleic acid-binding protein